VLKHLHIRNLAVIEELEIGFEPGMTVFTGETGAGKSIIVDALGLVLGDRADNSILRADADSAEITAIFSVDQDDIDIRTRLEEQGITPEEEELILRRVINRDGRSRAWANGSPIPIQVLRELGEEMVDIHGQHEHQSLLRRDMQRTLLDAYGWYSDVLTRVREKQAEWSAAVRELKTLTGNDQDREARLSLLRFQVEELTALNVSSAELETLTAEHTRLANASRLLDSCRQSWEQLTEDEHALLSGINRNIHELRGLVQFDHSLTRIVELLEGAAIEVKEAGVELRHYLDTLDPDPVHMQVVEERLAAIHDMARKHKTRPEELPDYLQALQKELRSYEAGGQRVAELEQSRDRALKDYSQAADELHTWRVKTAKKLAREIEQKLKDLGMPAARFTIEVQKTEKETPLQEGMDQIEFLVAVNPGQDQQPLTKVASGGELSRISLAIQVIGSKDKGLPVLIFDEVDAGIGGAIAEIVGNLLHSLAVKRQVFCVTHLPQVAALGDQHLQVNKATTANTTVTEVKILNREQRIEEIARMLGGVKITGTTRAHAKEMLSSKK